MGRSYSFFLISIVKLLGSVVRNLCAYSGSAPL